MKLKTYTASTMAQALAQVRRDLGADAMILHTRSFRTGSWLGLGGKPMVEITASSPQPSKSPKSHKTRRVRQTTTSAGHAPQHAPGQVAEHEIEHGPEIVVQRSRMLQPTTREQVTQAPIKQKHASSQSEPMDDRAALLQGLMGGVGPEVSPIRDRRSGVDSEQEQAQEQEQEQAQYANHQIAREPEAHSASDSHDDGFTVTTFRSITDLEVGLAEPAIQEELVPEPVQEPLIVPGSSPEFEVVEASNVAGPDEQLDEQSDEQPDEQEVTAVDGPVDGPIDGPAKSVIEPKPDASEAAGIQSQIDTLQKMMGQVLETTRRTAVAVNKSNSDASLPPVEMSAPLQVLYLAMIDNDVSVELADRFVGAVRDRLDADELGNAEVVRHGLLREIESSIQTVGESFLTHVGHAGHAGHADGAASAASARPHVIALIGPTGVGKTTTVAKIAATAKLRHGKRVALITSDTYRIAAVEQLRTYASIIGLDIRIANNPDEMRSVIESLSGGGEGGVEGGGEGVDQIVIDTAGRSQNNHARLDELGDLIKAAQPDETHLVLSSTVGENVLRKTAERFMALGPDRCILTKLDEAVTTGLIAGFNERVGLPLSFVTVGQEVPDDILVARSERLARAVLDGPAAVVPGF